MRGFHSLIRYIEVWLPLGQTLSPLRSWMRTRSKKTYAHLTEKERYQNKEAVTDKGLYRASGTRIEPSAGSIDVNFNKTCEALFKWKHNRKRNSTLYKLIGLLALSVDKTATFVTLLSMHQSMRSIAPTILVFTDSNELYSAVGTISLLRPEQHNLHDLKRGRACRDL